MARRFKVNFPDYAGSEGLYNLVLLILPILVVLILPIDNLIKIGAGILIAARFVYSMHRASRDGETWY